MPSLRGRLLNTIMRIILRSVWSSGVTIQDVRRRVKFLDRVLSNLPSNVSVNPVTIDGVPCQWIAPEGRECKRVVYYIHGGGFVTHLPNLYVGFAAQLSHLLEARVLLVDYRLAPEHPFPAAPEDCLRVYRRLLADPEMSRHNLVLAGDSAGGNLALVTLLSAKSEGLQMPAAAWLLSPAVSCDWSEDEFSSVQEQDPMLSANSLDLLDSYFGDANRSDPRLSPLNGELEGLPPILIEAGELDLFRDHPERFAEQARVEGVQVRSRIWPSMPHVFQLFGFLPEARHARHLAVEFLCNHMPDKRANRGLGDAP